MADVQIDDARLRNLQSGYDLLNRLHADPKTSAALRKAIAEIDPELKLPDPPAPTIIRPIEQRVDKLAETVESLAKTLADDAEMRRNAAADSSLSARINAASTRFGFNEEGIKLATDRMIAQKSGDVEGAFAAVAADNPKPQPMPSSGFPHLADPFGVRGSEDEDLKMLHTQPDQWQQETIERLIAEQNGR